MPEEALAGAGVGVCIDEALQLGVVIPGLEIVEAGVVILVVAPVAEGVHEGDEVGGRGVGNQSTVGIPDRCDLAPGVVLIGGNDLRPGAVGVPLVKTNNVALQVFSVIVNVGERGLAAIPEADPHRAAVLVVLELQRPVPFAVGPETVLRDQRAPDPVILRPTPVRIDLLRPQTVRVIGVRGGLSVLGPAGQLAAIPPGKGRAVVICQRDLLLAVIRTGAHSIPCASAAYTLLHTLQTFDYQIWAMLINNTSRPYICRVSFSLVVNYLQTQILSNCGTQPVHLCL